MGSNILICGITFKENVPDIRNSRVVDIIFELNQFGVIPHVWDPVVDKEEVKEEYDIDIIDKPLKKRYNAVLLAVKHHEIISIGEKGLSEFLSENGIFYDIKEVIK